MYESQRQNKGSFRGHFRSVGFPRTVYRIELFFSSRRSRGYIFQEPPGLVTSRYPMEQARKKGGIILRVSRWLKIDPLRATVSCKLSFRKMAKHFFFPNAQNRGFTIGNWSRSNFTDRKDNTASPRYMSRWLPIERLITRYSSISRFFRSLTR